MSPHPSLHPRSRLTTSLFGTTLLVSFLVVGMPHILPCPRPRVVYSDTDLPYDAQGRRRRRPSASINKDPASDADRAGDVSEEVDDARGNTQEGLDTRICGQHAKAVLRRAEEERVMARQREEMRRRGHECPVPKPGGWVGRVLGFGGGKSDRTDGEEG